MQFAQVAIMSAASVERSLAIDAAIKACEHFAGEITNGIPHLAATSSACEELKMCACPAVLSSLRGHLSGVSSQCDQIWMRQFPEQSTCSICYMYCSF